MSVKLPGVTITDAEYIELAERIGRYGDYLQALKTEQIAISDRIAFRAWWLHQADRERAEQKQRESVNVSGMSGPSIG